MRWLILIAVLGCSERAPAAPACETDGDCTGPWKPSDPVAQDGARQTSPNCGPVDRCSVGQCLPPAAIVGRAGPDTGSLTLQTPKGPRVWKVEVARSSFETTRGLMCRPSMLDDWGMLFIMSAKRAQRFWMKNTLIPLDMVFLDDKWKVVGVAADVQPLDLSGAGVATPSRYVLEINAGQAEAHGIEAGVQAKYTPPESL